jgi:predicted O-methyltransferase YrrM
MIRVKIFCQNSDFDNTSNWRAYMQYKGDIDGIEIEYDSSLMTYQENDLNYDVIIIIRPLSGYINYIRFLKKNGVKVIVDYDDPFPLIFSSDKLIEHFNEVLQIIKESDIVTTSTEMLKNYLYSHSFNNNIKVLPNVINNSLISENKTYHYDKVVLGWFGSSGHYESLKKIKDVIINVLNEYSNVYFNLYAPSQDFFDLFDHPRVNKFMYIFNFLEFQENIGEIDINLAPLVEDYHTLLKSNIRIILPGYKGIPSIADNFGEYKLLGKENVILCDNNDDWYNGIKKLINDIDLRNKIGVNIKKYVTENLTYDVWKPIKTEMFKSLVNQNKNMEHFYHNIGEDWFSYPNLYSSMVKKFNDGAHFIEIGSWKGRSASYMGVEINNSGKNIKFDCIDVFSGSSEHLDSSSPFFNQELLEDNDWLYNEFLKNTEPIKHIITPIKQLSWLAAELYDDHSVDFVFIDAAHDYESVKKDLKAWFPKIKKGGVLAGHDYLYWEVSNAVNEFFGENKIEVNEGCWIYQKEYKKINHFYQNIGEDWFGHLNFYSEMVNEFPDGSHFVEVGVWKGRGATYMGVEINNSGKNIKFDCVDTWEYIDSQNDISKDLYENLYNIFLKNIEPVKHIINPVKLLSTEAAKKYEDYSLDFVFIDAAHDYTNVKNDIEAWFPKIKVGGIIAGHDYNTSIDGVKKAVNEFFNEKNVINKENCWIYKKN